MGVGLGLTDAEFRRLMQQRRDLAKKKGEALIEELEALFKINLRYSYLIYDPEWGGDITLTQYSPMYIEISWFEGNEDEERRYRLTLAASETKIPFYSTGLSKKLTKAEVKQVLLEFVKKTDGSQAQMKLDI